MDWLKLDNTAKIYPLMLKQDNQNMFRVNAELYERVQSDILLTALQNIAPRFPMLTKNLKKGFFWYYLDTNNSPFEVYEESPILLSAITLNNVNGYNFRVSYFEQRISIDFYHILCDGGAAMEFFKCLLFEYFTLLGKPLTLDAKYIFDKRDTASPEEFEDSFNKNFKKIRIKDLNVADLKGTPSYRIEGAQFITGKGVMTLTVDSYKMLSHSKALGCSVTEFLAATLIMSAYANKTADAKLTDNFCLFLPINIRRCYNSRSMRNFSMFARANLDISKDNLTLEECIAVVHDALIYATDKSVLDNRINTTVRPEQFIPMRIMPIPIKALIFKIGNRIFGKAKKSCSFSNLGVLNIPCLELYVDKFHFQMNTNPLVPYNVTCATFKGNLTISFLRSVIDPCIIRTFTATLIGLGFDVSVTSNDWEVKTNEM